MLFSIRALVQFLVPLGLAHSLSLPSFESLNPFSGTIWATVNPYANGISNLLCERVPTNLLCSTTVAAGHKVLQTLPAQVTMRHCSIFLATPHCCGQFCGRNVGGVCDAGTGACFCNPSGVPNVCQLIMPTEDTPPSLLGNNDNKVIEICKAKCASNPNGCTRPAAATDGIVGTVCMCYCDPPASA